MPVSEDELLAYQADDFESIRQNFEQTGILVMPFA